MVLRSHALLARSGLNEETTMAEAHTPNPATSDATAMRPPEARDFVQARLYSSEEEVIRDALRHLLQARPVVRIQLAVHRCQTEGLSLAKAAELAGVSWAQMKEILLEKGIAPRLGPETVEEAEAEAQVLREFFANQ